VGLFSALKEIVICVIVADVLYYFTYKLYIAGIFAILDKCAEVRAKNAAEIFVARIGKEAAAIRKHSYKCGERPVCISASIWRCIPSF
jgi:hypothetical protein